LEREAFLDIRRWPHWDGSYNIAPTELAPVVIATPEGNVCELMRFGLIPFAARGAAPRYSTINARVENLATSACWREPWRRGQRCLVWAAGFYEWHVLPDGKTKRPYLIRPADQESFAFAGLWDTSTAADGTVTRSFAIITLPASPLMAEIHNAKQREPAMLAREDCMPWLTGTREQARAVLRQYPDELLLAYPVSNRVNRPENDDASLVQPLAEPPVLDAAAGG
jgi:putative SOS response-associated peptidase YedK